MAGLKQTIKRLATSSFDNQQSKMVKEIMGSTTLSLLDVGAANGAYDRWSAFQKFINYFGVEPDSRSSKSVIKSNSSSSYNSESLITHALWHSKGEVTLNLCRKPMASSIYEPNRQFINLFPEPERNDIVDTIMLPSETVDRVAQQANVNFDVIKLDVQGAELDVLKGATNSLAQTLAIDIEVEFCELYKDQPLFDQIFSFLRKSGLEFIDFTYIYRWSPDSFNGLGQTTFSDALFMRAPEKVAESKDASTIRKFAMICAVYERGDLLIRLGNACAKNTSIEKETISRILDLGKLLSRRNARTQRQLNRATKIIRLFHPRVHAHILH
jgi:FkbM family methyltransferase